MISETKQTKLFFIEIGFGYSTGIPDEYNFKIDNIGLDHAMKS